LLSWSQAWQLMSLGNKEGMLMQERGQTSRTAEGTACFVKQDMENAGGGGGLSRNLYAQRPWHLMEIMTPLCWHNSVLLIFSQAVEH
jgi:hypothetical protein